MMSVLTAETLLTFGFETEEYAANQDRLRLKGLRLVVPNPIGGWLDMRHLCWLASQGSSRADHPDLDIRSGQALIAKLDRGLALNSASLTLASSLYMRTVRQNFIQAAVKALEPLKWQNLRTFTVMNDGWVLTPEEFSGTTAVQIKRQFRTHLNRIGITADAGFFLAFIHGEFEPVSRLHTLHFHGITTDKIADLMQSLVGRWGYIPTRTSASPLRRQRINDPVRQLSYLLKSYWPSKGIRELSDGSRKRDRRGGRIPEPYHTQYLLWLDRQRLSEMSVMVGGWSRRKGGSESMRRLYFSTVEG